MTRREGAYWNDCPRRARQTCKANKAKYEYSLDHADTTNGTSISHDNFVLISIQIEMFEVAALEPLIQLHLPLGQAGLEREESN